MSRMPDYYHPLQGSELKPVHEAQVSGPADPNETLRLSVCARQRPGSPPLPGHDYWVATPPGKRKFLSAEEFAAKHGAAREDLDAIARFAQNHGLSVVESSVIGRTVVLSGTVAQVNRAFGVELQRYESPRGSYRGHEGSIHVPRDIAPIVEAVFGLDTRRLGGHNGTGDPPGTTPTTPPSVASLYNFPPVPANISTQTIAVMEFRGGWTQTDIDSTLLGWGVLTSPKPVDVNVTGSNSPGDPIPDGEVMLDICVAAAIAPGAGIRVYWGSDFTSPMDWISVLNAMISDASAKPKKFSVVTNSIFLVDGDDTLSAMQANQLSSKFQALAVLGVTVFTACGDDGARSLTTDSKAHVQYPGSDPWLTSCGGTTISTSPSYVEWVWNDFNPTNATIPQATGGGVSAVFTGSLPPWQQVVSVPPSINDGTTIGRGVPDVAGNGSVNSGYMMTVDGSPSGPFCGTSAVSPLYAGLMAIINATLGEDVGFLNPTLYAFRESVCRDINAQALAGSPQDNSVPAFTNPFTLKHYPAVKGYPSGPGWDACTGLGIIDGGALLGVLQSVFQQGCQFIVDRMQIGKDEVSATLSGTAPGVIANAFYVVLDGFAASDPKLNIKTSDLFPNPPSVVPAFSVSVAGMSVVATALLAEDVSLPATPQRFTWICEANFKTDLSAFTTVPVTVTLSATIAGITSPAAAVELVAEADPYELDGPVSWLSTDLRVFQMKTGGSLTGLPSVALKDTGDAPADAATFIQAVIAGFNSNKTPPPGHPFDNISTDEQVSEVTLNQFDFNTGLPIFNFAVARVRYQSDIDSGFVRVFFRIFQVATTSTAYATNTYGVFSGGTKNGFKIPVYGVDGAGNVVAIPCFADARVAAGTTLDKQKDDTNTVPGGIKHGPVGAAVYTYFGCWLDINQPSTKNVPVGPIAANSTGPFASYQSVLETITGQHQCLVAEISYDDDPVQLGDTPASSDKLAQRNLAIVPSANPGNPASHLIPHPFDLRPTPPVLPKGARIDELMIQWGNTPTGSVASIYLPGVSAAEVLTLAAKMYVTHRLTLVDEHTLRCPTGGATWIPVPRGPAANFAGLLTVELPPNVRKGQAFTIVARQVTNTTVTQIGGGQPGRGATVPPAFHERRVLGSFQVTIPVRVAGVLLGPEERLLAIMRFIGESIPRANRWAPVLQRYIAQIALRVEGFGGNPANIPPSGSGSLPSDGGHRY